MSKLQVLGGISAAITIIDCSVKISEGGGKTVSNGLPILRDTVRTCHEHHKHVPPLPVGVAVHPTKTIRSRESKAERLRTIFQETIPGDKDC